MADNEACSECGAQFRWAPEKGVDTAIVTDLLSLASEDAFDVAILLSSDADHIPAVEWVQAHGRKAINATGEVLSGSLSPRALRLVREWLELHRAELELNFERLANEEQPYRVEPLT